MIIELVFAVSSFRLLSSSANLENKKAMIDKGE